MTTAALDFRDFELRNRKIAVVGLGYTGLPVALALGKKYSVIGFDIDAARIERLQACDDPGKEMSPGAFEGADIRFSSDARVLKDASFYIVTVPTPVDEHFVPDLQPLRLASKLIGEALQSGDAVVYESTVYPGCTEEVCVPILSDASGLDYPSDYWVGYSPERINPGDKQHIFSNVVKVIASNQPDMLALMEQLYGSVIEAGVFKAASIAVAEAAKVVENTQRDLNISLMNELSQIFSRMNISTYDVLEAAGTKWNFLKFQPGLVGGHCIGVDPYYLTYKASQLGYTPQIILSGRGVNNGMAGFIARKLVQHFTAAERKLSDCKVLIMGITFKENVSDIRNSKIYDLYKELKSFHIQVDVTDPLADSKAVIVEYGVALADEISDKYDAVVVSVAHDAYKALDETWFSRVLQKDGLIMDVKNIYKAKISNFARWTL